jgi:hypothetical protein
MDTIREYEAAMIRGTTEEIMSLQMQIMKTQERLKNLEDALKKVDSCNDQTTTQFEASEYLYAR